MSGMIKESKDHKHEYLGTNINGILPPELFIHNIFKYLNLQELHSALLTCKKWHNYILAYLETKGIFYLYNCFLFLSYSVKDLNRLKVKFSLLLQFNYQFRIVFLQLGDVLHSFFRKMLRLLVHQSSDYHHYHLE